MGAACLGVLFVGISLLNSYQDSHEHLHDVRLHLCCSGARHPTC